jgi:hypothetical protein
MSELDFLRTLAPPTQAPSPEGSALALARLSERIVGEEAMSRRRRRLVLAAVATGIAAAIPAVAFAGQIGNLLGLSGSTIHPRVKPAAIQAKLDELNQRYDDCMARNGAPHIDLANGGWTYPSNPSADTACQADLAAIQTYVDSAEYHASDAETQKLLEHFWSCVNALPTRADAAVRACADKSSTP